MIDLRLPITCDVIIDYSIGNAVSREHNISSMEDSLGHYVVQMRTKIGLKQNQLAERAGLPATTINRIEKGVTKLPSADIRRRLATALGLSHLDILVAAGEITREEVSAGGVEQRDELSGVPPQVVTALRKISTWTTWHSSQMLRQVDNLIDMEGIINQATINAVESLGGRIGEGGVIEFPNFDPKEDRGEF